MGRKEAGPITSSLETLCKKALALGASEAVAIEAADVAVDERVGLKCQVPLCPHYGRDLMCPPNVIGVAQFREAIKRYHGAILVKVDIPQSELALGKPRKTAKASKTDYLHTLRSSQTKLLEILGRVEAACMEQGYSLAAGLAAGACPLCEECVGVGSGLPCRHPFRARPSMEAVGIDVMATARKAGLKLGFGEDDGRSWVGLVLVD